MIALALFLIPAALVFLTVSTVSGWTRLLVFGAGLLVLSIWPSPTGDLLRAIALLYMLVPVMPLLLFHLRFWRGAAPLVFLLSLTGFSGSVLAMGLVSGALGIGFGPFAWLARGVGFAVGLGLGVWFLRRVTKRHTRAPITEHAFALDTWWLLYTLVQSFVVSIGLGIGAGSVVLLSFLLGRWITQRALGRIDGPEAAPLRLLLLRVSGNSRRSERLFEQLAQVKLAEVVASLEGHPAPSAEARNSPEFQVLASLEDQLERARQQVLQQTTLQDLLEQRNSLAQSQIMYFI